MVKLNQLNCITWYKNLFHTVNGVWGADVQSMFSDKVEHRMSNCYMKLVRNKCMGLTIRVHLVDNTACDKRTHATVVYITERLWLGNSPRFVYMFMTGYSSQRQWWKRSDRIGQEINFITRVFLRSNKGCETCLDDNDTHNREIRWKGVSIWSTITSGFLRVVGRSDGWKHN